jgi:hypothetical protein
VNPADVPVEVIDAVDVADGVEVRVAAPEPLTDADDTPLIVTVGTGVVIVPVSGLLSPALLYAVTA